MKGKSSHPSPIQTIGSRIVWSSPWYRIRQDDILLPDGQSGTYNVVEHPGAVWIHMLATAFHPLYRAVHIC